MNDELDTCDGCGGFLPRASSACPNCRRAIPAWVLRAATVVGGGALAMTLSACYGAGCAGGRCYEPRAAPSTDCGAGARDADYDGVCSDRDCDDADATVGACASSPASSRPAESAAPTAQRGWGVRARVRVTR